MPTIRPISYVKRKLQERETKYKEETPTDRAARRTTNATVWMAFFTFVLVLVGIGTYFILKNQLKEMHEGGTDTHSLAVAANESIAASHRDQRAWLGAGDGTFTITSQRLEAGATIKNVGKAPAIEATSNIAWIGKRRGDPLQLSDIAYPSPDLANGTLFPSQTTQIQNRLPEPVPAYQAVFVERLKAGDDVLYVIGKIQYRDIFRVQHWTHFCMVVHRDLTSNNACDIYTDSDPEPLADVH